MRKIGLVIAGFLALALSHAGFAQQKQWDFSTAGMTFYPGSVNILGEYLINGNPIGGSLSIPTAPLLSGNGSSLGPVTAIDGLTIGGVTPAPGNFTSLGTTGTFALGAGGSSSAQLTQNGTGNFSVLLGGSASLINFKTSSGTSMMTIGGSTPTINPALTMVFSKPTVWSGAGAVGNSVFYMNNTWSGTAPAGTQGSIALLQMAGDTVAMGAGGSLTEFNVNMDSGGAAMTGNRHAGSFFFTLTSTSGNAAATYTGANFSCAITANDNGTGLTPNTAKGACFGVNPVAHAGPSATFLNGIIGDEIDTWTETGSSMLNRIGLQIVDVTGSNVQGTQDDTAISLNNQYVQGSGAGWKVGFAFGRAGGGFPMAATGTLMNAATNAGTLIVNHGFDFHNVTFTTDELNFPGFLVDGTGSTKVNTIQVTNMQTTCVGAPSGTIANVSSILTLCP